MDDGVTGRVCPTCDGTGRIETPLQGRHLVSAACKALGISEAVLRAKGRRDAVMAARQVLMMLLRDQGYQCMTIAGWVGVADHTTVIHGSRRAERMLHIGREPWASVYERIIEGVE